MTVIPACMTSNRGKASIAVIRYDKIVTDLFMIAGILKTGGESALQRR